LIIAKPDAVQRSLSGEVLRRMEQRGLRLIGLKFMMVPRPLAEEHYAEHQGKGFYEGLVSYIMSGPVVVMAFEGKNAVAAARKTIGATKPHESEAGTLRGDYAIDVSRNLVHGSDKAETGQREVALWFREDELLSGWSRTIDPWLFD
jgi:nucleoside-diphosphate kinase